MPWRLIKFIVIFALFLIFIFFNIDNKSDINFGFTRIREAPVYLTVFTSFVIGMAVTFLSAFICRQHRRKRNGGKNGKPESPRKKKKKQAREKIGGYSETETERGRFTDSGHYGID
jgi:uncharacterized integral membrane protein